VAAEKTQKVDVTIRIDKAEAHRFDEIVEALKKKGLGDLQPHQRFMIVNGSISAERLSELNGVAGVASVRKDQVYKAQES
jgi:methylmalonyl-CoA mutase cobalamin-binding subunit